MNTRIVIASIVLLSGFTACSDSSSAPEPVAETTVNLTGSIGQSTRAAIGSGYAEELKVGFVRQDETAVSAGSYGTWRVCSAVREGGAGNRPIVFDELQLYPSDGRAIRLHGYYPAVEESTVDAEAGKVFFTLDGLTDIMATGCLAATTYTPLRTCLFRHLLTQVRLVCYSDRAEQWGAIAKIEALEVHTRQELDCGLASPSLANASSGDGVKNIAVPDIAGLQVPQVAEGEDPPEPQGYILLPVSSADGETDGKPLRLRITTTKDGSGNEVETITPVSVTVAGGFQPGQTHLVSLFFTGNSAVQITSVRVEAWTDRDVGEWPI